MCIRDRSITVYSRLLPDQTPSFVWPATGIPLYLHKLPVLPHERDAGCDGSLQSPGTASQAVCQERQARSLLHPVHGAELEIYVNIAEYLWLARRKTEFDLAEAYYTQ